MNIGRHHACQETGFVETHAIACESVAKQVNSIILFREPGKMARGLIEEHYCMKGFRIDTKSCNFGPMSGFVCMDPRLTKDAVRYGAKNAAWTAEALSGHIVKKFFGEVQDSSWVADVMPIAISRQRVEELARAGTITPRQEEKDLVGESEANDGTLILWRLVPIGNANTLWWLKVENASNYYVVCVNTRGPKPFNQQYPSGVSPILFKGHETILGLINPGTKDRGFKACVTADYDLFSVWPAIRTGEVFADPVAARHNLNNEFLQRRSGPLSARPLPGGVLRLGGVDNRPTSTVRPDYDPLLNRNKDAENDEEKKKKRFYREHHRFGDVSARLMLTKSMLNTALRGAAGYQGGNAVHHNDETGNFALAKGSLEECMSLIAYLPRPFRLSPRADGPPQTVLISNRKDFYELAWAAKNDGFDVRAKPDWLPPGFW